MNKRFIACIFLIVSMMLFAGCEQNSLPDKESQITGEQEVDIFNINKGDINVIDVFYNGDVTWEASFYYYLEPQLAVITKDEMTKIEKEDMSALSDFLIEHWAEFTVDGTTRHSSGVAMDTQLPLWQIVVYGVEEKSESKLSTYKHPSIWNDFIDVLNETLEGEYIEKVDESLLEN